MSLSDFFGQQSPFQIIVAAVALATALYTFYKSFFERAKLAVYTGDRVGLVISPGGGVSRFQLHCNLVNNAVKLGTVNRVEAIMRSPDNHEYRFAWNLFFEYTAGGVTLQKLSEPYPIAVTGKSNSPVFVEFVTVGGREIRQWPEGEYRFQLIGWANLDSRCRTPNVTCTFHARITSNFSATLEQQRPGQPEVVYAPITEWATLST